MAVPIYHDVLEVTLEDLKIRNSVNFFDFGLIKINVEMARYQMTERCLLRYELCVVRTITD